MRITLFLYPDNIHFMARREPDGHSGDAWPIQRHALSGREILDAVVSMPGAEGTETHRFSYDGTNWVSSGEPIAQVRATDMLPIEPAAAPAVTDHGRPVRRARVAPL